MYPFFTAALCLMLAQSSLAVIPHPFQGLAQTQSEDPESNGIIRWLGRWTKKAVAPRQDGTCYIDFYYNFVFNSSFGEDFCQIYMQYPNQTTTIDYYPTSTVDQVSLVVYTDYAVTRTTPVAVVTITTTITVAANAKRNAQATPMPRDLTEMQMQDVFSIFRRQANISTSDDGDDASMSSAFSSACSCQTYQGATITETYTDEAIVVTRTGFVPSTTTLVSTRTDGTVISYVTVTDTVISNQTFSAAEIISSSVPQSAQSTTVETTVIQSETTSSSVSTPTAPAFTCPDDNNTTVSQMVGNERFDYLILCNTDLPSDSLLYGYLAYTTFGQCVAACSVADSNFDQPVCVAAAYFNSPNTDGYNCFLKSSANSPVPVTGASVAILQRIAIGISDTTPSGTAVESAPFTDETSTVSSDVMSSSLSSMMQNSSSTMPIVTPNPGSVPGVTMLSTYVSGGATFSTESIYTTYFSSNGSWYFSYYETFLDAWTVSSTVYAESPEGTSVASTGDQSTSQQSDDDGDYSQITVTNQTTYYYYSNGTEVAITTEIIANSTFNANGTEVSASTTTLLFSETGSSAVINGNGSVSGYSSAGVMSTQTLLSTSVLSTQTVIVSSGAISEVTSFETSVPQQTEMPSIYSTVLVNSGGTAYSTGYVVSGYVVSSSNGTFGATSGAGSGGSVIIQSGGTAYGSGYVISGMVTVSSNGTSGASGTAASGVVTPPFTDSNAPRSGTEATSSTVPLLNSLSAPGYGSIPMNGSTTSPSSGNGTSITGTSTLTDSISEAPRSGTYTITTTVEIFSFNGSISNSSSSAASHRSRHTGYSMPGSGPAPYSTPTAGTGLTTTYNATSTGTASISNDLRSGTDSSSSFGSVQTSSPCINGTMGTTTIFVTTTEYGCYSSCLPSGWGQYGEPPK